MNGSKESLASSVTRNCTGAGNDRSLVGILQADWRAMYRHDDTKDMELVVGADQKVFRVHSIVLTARCDRMRDRASNGSAQLTLHNLSPSAVDKIVRYLYSAELEVTNAVDIVPLLMVAYELGLPSLRSYFLQCLEYLLSNSNVCKVLTVAHFHYDNYKELDRDLQHDLQRIQDASLQYIIGNFKVIMSSQTILDLDKEALKLIVSSKLPIGNQEMLRSILKWGRLKAGTAKVMQSDWTEEERKAVRGHIEEVIPHVQLADGRPLSPDSISDGVYGILERSSWAESCSLSSEECFPESVILSQHQQCVKTLAEWCGHSRPWVLMYRGSEYGFSAKEFHARCDNTGPSVTVVLTTDGYVFGGFTDVSWNGKCRRGKYYTSHHSFMFSIFNPSKTPPANLIKYHITQPSYAINSHPNYGPIFGSGADLCISGDCSRDNQSYSRMTSYGTNDHTSSDSISGSYYFNAQEYEVFGQQS